MKRSQRSLTALAFASLLVGSHAAAQAPSEPEATRLVFQAPEGCGSAQDFSARVERRSARIRLGVDVAAGPSLLVEIQAIDAAGGLRGRVTLVEPGGAKSARQLKAATCEEALDGLSLIATVTLDPEALLGEPAPDEPEPPKPKPERTKPKPAPPPPTIPATRSEFYRISFGLGAEVLLRVAAEVAPGAQASVALELNPGVLLAPFLRLSVTHAQRRGLDAGAGEANFAYTLPSLELCPVRVGSPVFGIRPCGFGSVGVVKAWGSAAPEREEHLRLAGSAGVSLLALLRLGKTFEIIADGRAGLPFERDTFGFDDVASFKTPTPGFSAGLGVAGGFP